MLLLNIWIPSVPLFCNRGARSQPVAAATSKPTAGPSRYTTHPEVASIHRSDLNALARRANCARDASVGVRVADLRLVDVDCEEQERSQPGQRRWASIVRRVHLLSGAPRPTETLGPG